MWFAPPPPPPVSYSRDVAPVLAMRCNGCHGDAGGLSTRTYAELMAGGNLGRVVLAGDPDGSLLIHYLDGRRGERRRMPLGGKPLPAAQIAIIRRWIGEGAHEDALPLPVHVRQTRGVSLPSGRVLRISCRVAAEAYVTIRAIDPAKRSVLFERSAAVKAETEDGDAGRPGDRLMWEVRSGAGWPPSVDIELRVEYAAGDPGELHLLAELAP